MPNDEADRIDRFVADYLPANTSMKQRARILDALTRSDDLVFGTQSGPPSAARLTPAAATTSRPNRLRRGQRSDRA